MKTYDQIARDINETVNSAWEAGHRVAFEEVERMYSCLNDKEFIYWLDNKLSKLSKEKKWQ